MTELTARLPRIRVRRPRPPHPFWWTAAAVATWCVLSSIWQLWIDAGVAGWFVVIGNAFAVGACWPQLIRPYEWVRIPLQSWFPAWAAWFVAAPLAMATI